MNTSLYKHYYPLAILIAHSIHAFDNPHFFRPRIFPGEPRLVKEALFTFDCIVDAGSGTCSRNRCHKLVPLLDLYGSYNIQQSILNVPLNTPYNQSDNLLIQLAALPTNGCFGHLSFGGLLRIREAAFDIYYNMYQGWFAHLYLPIRSLTIDNITQRDLSPTASSSLPNRTNPIWQQVLGSFGTILSQFNLSLAPSRSVGLGDLTALIGWTHNEERSTRYLDFIDTTVEIGIIMPTGKRADPRYVFSVPTGYDGHVGIPIVLRTSCGAFDWLTFGGSVEGRFFFDRTTCLHLKTAEAQQGLIFLAQGLVKRHLGNLWSFDLFAKADHVFKGLSCLLGYTYDHQQRSHLYSCSPLFNNAIINSNNALFAWSMHTFHLLVDYDFSSDQRPWGPRVGVLYNYQINGKQVFAPHNIGGISLGIEMVYCW